MPGHDDFVKIIEQLNNVSIIDKNRISIDNAIYEVSSETDFRFVKDDIIYRLIRGKSLQMSTACLELLGAMNPIEGNALVLPKCVTRISSCSSYIHVSTMIGYGVTEIGKEGFKYTKIKKVVFPNLTSLEPMAFRNSCLQYIPDLSKLDGKLTGFTSCERIVGSQKILPDGNIVYEKGIIRIPKNITRIEDGFGIPNPGNFNIIFDPVEGESEINIERGFAYMKISSIKNLEKYKNISGELLFIDCAIPDMIVTTNITAKKLFNDSKMSSVTDLREEISDSSYSSCIFIKLDKLNFPNVKRIGKSAFYYTNITSTDSLNLPSNQLDCIDNYAFSTCDDLSNVSINTKWLGKGAFFNCSNIKNFKINDDAELDDESIPFYLSKSKANFGRNNICLFKYWERENVVKSGLSEYGDSYYAGTKENPYEVCVHTDMYSSQNSHLPGFDLTNATMSHLTLDKVNQLKQLSVNYHPDCKCVVELDHGGAYDNSSILSRIIDIKDNIEYETRPTRMTSYVSTALVSSDSLSTKDSPIFPRNLIIKDNCKNILMDDDVSKIKNIIFPTYVKNFAIEIQDKNAMFFGEINIYLPEKIDNMKNVGILHHRGSKIRFHVSEKTSFEVVKFFAELFGYNDNDISLKIEIMSSDESRKNQFKTINYRDYVKKHIKVRGQNHER